MKPIFRSSMFGFHKGDVFNFITKQNKQYEAKISDLNLELEKVKTEAEDERQAFERDMTELETLRNSVEQLNSKIASFASSVSEILEYKSKILTCAVALQNEQTELGGKLNEMQLRVVEAEKFRAKAEKFDQLSGVLSSIFNQPEIAVSQEIETLANATNDSVELQAVSDLVSLLEDLSAHCENLQNHLAIDQKNA